MLTGVALLVLGAVGAGITTINTASNVVPPTYAGVTQIQVTAPGWHNLIQEDPFGATVSSRESEGFEGHLHVLGARGELRFVTETVNSVVAVSEEGGVSLRPHSVAPGIYSVTGYAVDSRGDTGTWAFTLTVTADGRTSQG
ncbi:MAG: hypothetical protein HKL87_02430 [Acidimicrobiaceae bacterium]|nr:hypothetical protein [Acidimicrobiaceae bacterium]